MSGWFHRENGDLVPLLRVQPRAGRNAFGEVMEGRRKLYLKASPVEGKANRELVKFLAKTMKVAKGQVRIESGETGRNKRVRILGLDSLPSKLADV